MTYAKLLEELKGLTPEQLNCDATIYLIDINEYFGIGGIDFTDEEDCDVLDNAHPILFIK